MLNGLKSIHVHTIDPMMLKLVLNSRQIYSIVWYWLFHLSLKIAWFKSFEAWGQLVTMNDASRNANGNVFANHFKLNISITSQCQGNTHVPLLSAPQKQNTKNNHNISLNLGNLDN